MAENFRTGRAWTLAAAFVAGAFAVLADITVEIDHAVRLGPIKPMNAVNNGPQRPGRDQTCGNFADFKRARIPYGRTHDSRFACDSNGHVVDISAVFPDFTADENNPASYDFADTDEFLRAMIEAGTEPFFRLGETIENGVRKRFTKPPTDFAKWARVCEHVVAHYTEGWANGFKWKIEYWEIWNEADAQPDENREQSCQWGGTKAEFFAFYETVAKHLKRRFPNLKIGGPALGFRMDWAKDFVRYQKAHGTPVDFFSWHVYQGGIGRMRQQGRDVRKMLDENGYSKAESILDEWNYVKGWTAEFQYSREAMNAAKGAAFTAAALATCQSEPIDLLMYYDARTATIFNGLFDFYTFAPRGAYYALVAWSDLRDLGTQARASVSGAFGRDFVAATAAVGQDGTVGLLLVRFCDDNNRTAAEKTTIGLAGGFRFNGKIHAYLTDEHRLGSVFPLAPDADGRIIFSMEPNSFVYLEGRAAKDNRNFKR